MPILQVRPQGLPHWTDRIAPEAGLRDGRMELEATGQRPELTLQWAARWPASQAASNLPDLPVFLFLLLTLFCDLGMARRALTWLALLGACGSLAARPEDNALFEAVNKDDMGLIKAALEAGANIDVQGPGGQSPLMHAVLGGKLAAVKFLLKRGADASIPEKDGYTPMHGAGFQGRAEIARVLHSYGVALDDVHADGHPPITRACWGRDKRHAETVEALLDLGATLASAADCPTTNPHTRDVLARRFPAAGNDL